MNPMFASIPKWIFMSVRMRMLSVANAVSAKMGISQVAKARLGYLFRFPRHHERWRFPQLRIYRFRYVFGKFSTI